MLPEFFGIRVSQVKLIYQLAQALLLQLQHVFQRCPVVYIDFYRKAARILVLKGNGKCTAAVGKFLSQHLLLFFLTQYHRYAFYIRTAIVGKGNGNWCIDFGFDDAFGRGVFFEAMLNISAHNNGIVKKIRFAQAGFGRLPLIGIGKVVEQKLVGVSKKVSLSKLRGKYLNLTIRKAAAPGNIYHLPLLSNAYGVPAMVGFRQGHAGFITSIEGIAIYGEALYAAMTAHFTKQVGIAATHRFACLHYLLRLVFALAWIVVGRAVVSYVVCYPGVDSPYLIFRGTPPAGEQLG